MNKNPANEQIPLKRKKTPSWVLGIITILLSIVLRDILGLVVTMLKWLGDYQCNLFEGLLVLSYGGTLIIAIWGLTRGIKELKLPRK